LLRTTLSLARPAGERAAAIIERHVSARGSGADGAKV
jgi:hypothetical protein